jgi:hypothetical protein
VPTEEDPQVKDRHITRPDGAGLAEAGGDREAIRLQLGRILGSAAFRQSKRYSSMLKYLVEQTLEGRAEELKERTLGAEVFGRLPDYDTSSDHIVRSAGSEIRKRLAQYYQEPGHESEIRVDLHPGSYVPQFRYPGNGLAEPAVAPSRAATQPAPRSRRLNRWLVLAAVFSAGSAVTLGVTLLAGRSPQTALDRFWAPVTSAPSSVLLCIGNDQRAETAGQRAAAGSSDAAAQASQTRGMGFHVVAFEDAVTLARLSGMLQSRGKEFRIFNESVLSLDDLRERTTIFIGALNNDWSLHLLKLLRFRFERDTPGVQVIIRDTQNPSKEGWAPVPPVPPGAGSARDYAIVARCPDPETGHMALIVAGTHAFGTLAAGEFLTNLEHMRKLEVRAPVGWERKNLQVVLSTDVIKGVAGPPTIVATHFW